MVDFNIFLQLMDRHIRIAFVRVVLANSRILQQVYGIVLGGIG